MPQKKEQGEETYFLLLALFFNRIFTIQSHLSGAGGVDTTQHYKTYIATYTLKLMEVLLVDVCGSGFGPYVIFHCFFNSCLWKKPFSVTIERG